MSRQKVNPLRGAVRAGEATLPEIWQKLHIIAKAWSDIWESDDLDYERSILDRNTATLIAPLADVPANRWFSLCETVGWTSYGAVALSWCQDAILNDVWSGWLKSGFVLKPEREFERPAQFINPALLPDTRKLSVLIEAFSGEHFDNEAAYELAICATISRFKQAIELDLPITTLEKAGPQVASFLRANLQKRQTHSGHDQNLIKAWTNTIKHSEWAVWSEKET